MKGNVLVRCLAGVAAAIGLLLIAGVQPATLFLGAAALACPLMMVLMMRGMMHEHGHAFRNESARPQPGDQHAGRPREAAR